MQIPEAQILPITAEDSPAPFIGKTLYSLPDMPGIYRRVPRDGRVGLTSADGNVVAIIGNTLCEVVRWPKGEQILRPLLPGMESPNDKPF